VILCDLILGDFGRKFQSQECDAPRKIKMFNPVNNFFVGIVFNFYVFSKLLMFVVFRSGSVPGSVTVFGRFWVILCEIFCL